MHDDTCDTRASVYLNQTRRVLFARFNASQPCPVCKSWGDGTEDSDSPRRA